MEVKVKFFAILREKVGAEELTTEAQTGTTVNGLWESLKETYPALAVPGLRLLYAVNKSYVTGDYVLHEQDEVVFIPPVSGG
jgi:molybdopterin converting factor subunit 1